MILQNMEIVCGIFIHVYIDIYIYMYTTGNVILGYVGSNKWGIYHVPKNVLHYGIGLIFSHCWKDQGDTSFLDY